MYTGVDAVTPQQALCSRIRQLRQRFFGRSGTGEFAARLGLSRDAYESFEGRVVPPGDVLVRMCEITGEDLQWLLTGVASRGALVITETRSRHRDLLTRLAELLDRSAHLAPAVEAFLDLLTASHAAEVGKAPELPSPPRGELIPVLQPDEVPAGPLGESPVARPLLAADTGGAPLEEQPRVALEPATSFEGKALTPAALVMRATGSGVVREYVRSDRLAPWPAAFAVRVGDDSMSPMFAADDVAIVEPATAPRVGCPALCRVRGESSPRCRIWLGRDADHVQLGRLAGGELEQVPAGELVWALLVLLCITARGAARV